MSVDTKSLWSWTLERFRSEYKSRQDQVDQVVGLYRCVVNIEIDDIVETCQMRFGCHPRNDKAI